MSNVLDTSLARKPAGGVLPRFRDRGQVLTARPKAEAVEHRLLPMSRTSEPFVRMKQAAIVLFADMERKGEIDWTRPHTVTFRRLTTVQSLLC